MLIPLVGKHCLMIFDFAEAVPWTNASGNLDGAVEWVATVVERFAVLEMPAQGDISDACTTPLPDDSASVWFTDPPYYFAVPYADLSDFFFVWLKRALPNDLTQILVSPWLSLANMAS